MKYELLKYELLRMLRRQVMKDVKVNREVLLKALKENRENHRTIFLEAYEGYRKAAIDQMDKNADDARKGKRVKATLTLVVPMDQTPEYDRAIRMLEMSVDAEILISEYDFQCYVMDQWQWKGQFNASNMMYSKTLSDQIGEQDQ